MNKIKVGFFSLSRLRDPAGYLEWHQMDHMPEQFGIAGLSWAQRFMATPACRRASAARAAPFVETDSLQLYLMEDPERVLPEFMALGRKLAGQGRLRTDIDTHLSGAFQLVETYASPRVLISAEVVPYRPNRGAYVIVEEIVDRRLLDPWVQRQHLEGVAGLLGVPGVVGIWSYASTGAYEIPRVDQRTSVVYLDDDPVVVSERLAPHLESRWRDAPVRPVLAGPFVSLFPPPTEWDPSTES